MPLRTPTVFETASHARAIHLPLKVFIIIKDYDYYFYKINNGASRPRLGYIPSSAILWANLKIPSDQPPKKYVLS